MWNDPFWISRTFDLANQMRQGYDSHIYGYQPPTTHPLSTSPEPNPYDYSFDEEAARREAGRASTGALLGGILNSYLNRGQGLGDAFHAQQATYEHVLNSARDDARQQALDKARAEEWRQTRQDRLQAEQDRQGAAKALEEERHTRALDEQHKAYQDFEAHQRILNADPKGEILGSDEERAREINRRNAQEDKPAHITGHPPGSYLYDDSGKLVGHVPDRPKTVTERRESDAAKVAYNDKFQAHVEEVMDKLAPPKPEGRFVRPEAIQKWEAVREAGRSEAEGIAKDNYKKWGVRLPDEYVDSGHPVVEMTGEEALRGTPSAGARAAPKAAVKAPPDPVLIAVIREARTTPLTPGGKPPTDSEIRAFLLKQGKHTAEEINRAFSSF